MSLMKQSLLFVLLGVWLFVGLPTAHAVADVDNHGQWEKPTENDAPDREVPGFYVNVGPTGARAKLTDKSTFIIRYIFPGSPAVGRLSLDDEIVGVFGKPFAAHTFGGESGYEGPIMDFGEAIERAEGSDGKLIVNVRSKSDSKQKEVTIQLEKLGSFSLTFPYNCPKSERIRERALQYFMTHPESLRGGKAHTRCARILAFLNCEEAKYQKIGKQLALEWTRSPSATDWTWPVSYQLISLGEYYTLTKDKSVLPTMQACADALVKAQYSGHIKKWEAKPGEDAKKLDEAQQLYDGGFGHAPYQPMIGGYGPMQYTTILAVTAWQIAARCGITVKEGCIKRALAFIHRGTNASGYVAYGGEFTLNNGLVDPERWRAGNGGSSRYVGRVGAAIVAHKLSPEFPDTEEYLAKYIPWCGTAYKGMPDGHADANLGIFWNMLGVAASGDEKVLRTTLDYHKAYFNMMRCFDGSFVLQPGRDYADYGYYNSSRYHPTASMILAYSLNNPKLLVMGIQVNIPGVNPKALTGKLDLAYKAIVEKNYAYALKAIKSQRGSSKITEEESAICDALSGYVADIFAKDLAKLESYKTRTDYYQLKIAFDQVKSNFSDLDVFDEHVKAYDDGLKGDAWKSEIKIGTQYQSLMKSLSRSISSSKIRNLERFAAKYPESLYGRWATEVLKTYEADGVIRDPAIAGDKTTVTQ